MDTRRVQAHVARIGRLFLLTNLLLTGAWLSAVTTPWLDLPLGIDTMPATDPGLGNSHSVGYVDVAKVKQAITGKAIFRTSRLLPEKVTDELGRYELRGISLRDGILKAYIRDVKRKRILIKEAGDSLGVFEIISVQRSRVTLRRGNEQLVLEKG